MNLVPAENTSIVVRFSCHSTSVHSVSQHDMALSSARFHCCRSKDTQLPLHTPRSHIGPAEVYFILKQSYVGCLKQKCPQTLRTTICCPTILICFLSRLVYKAIFHIIHEWYNSYTRYHIKISAGGTLAFIGKLRGAVTGLLPPSPPPCPAATKMRK